jgi:4-aminobutyrate aminotransferase-like enzyme
MTGPALVTEVPGPRSRAEMERIHKSTYVGNDYSSTGIVIAGKDGFFIEDLDGNRYIDMASGWGSSPIGAPHPEVLQATVDAMRRYGNEDVHHLTNELITPLAEKLIEISPSSLTRVDIGLSGTEAVEIALRLMRRATGRPLVLGFHGQYHGETAATVALGAELAGISKGIREITPGFVHVPYPNPYRTPFGSPVPDGSGDSTIDYVRDFLLVHAIHHGDIAGVVIEPVVGEGGVLIPPDGFWPALVELCAEYDWLLCVDEVESGMGRTGKMFAVENWGVEPDLMCLGKAVSGGVMPLAATLGSERVMGSFDDTETGSTWSWLPASCAGALKALEIYERDGVLDNVAVLEAVAREVLAPLVDKYPMVGDVRIMGTYIAVEFVRDKVTKERFLEFKEAVELATMRRGLIGIHHNASFRVLPPLTMPAEVFRVGMEIIDESIAEVAGSGLLSL